MAAIALDLAPVVSILIEHPFERKALDRAAAAVDGHPHAYATALRCAAKRTGDRLAAAYWLLEAARVHESVDDFGGAIALLWRARECDPENTGALEGLAACMTRLALRSGLSFTFSAGAPTAPASPSPTDESQRPPRRESGLRPASPSPRRDTLPDPFGIDSVLSRTNPDDVEWALYEEVTPEPEPPAKVEEPPKTLDSNPVVFPLHASRRVEPLLPPADPEWSVATVVPTAVAPQPVLRAVADIAMPTRRSSDLPQSLAPAAPALSPPPPAAPVERVSPAPSSLAREVYEDGAPRTLRPEGDGLVGELFEALHGLHFMDDVRSGAEFVAKVLHDSMGPSTVLVHVYDINSRHFVVMSAIGSRGAALVDYATPEDDPFVLELMKEDEAMLVLDPKDDPRLLRGRWLLAEPQRSVLCAPSSLEGRYLGLVEIADPADGSEFAEDDRNALTYAASAFARFLDRRGIVLSEEDEERSESYPESLPDYA